MPKKILILAGSPRKDGNTNLLVEWVADGAKENGAEVKVVEAVKLSAKVNGCSSCYGCQTSSDYRCVIQDEISDFVATIPDYDLVVLASPVYFFGFTAQIKIVIDRMYSLFKFNPETHKFSHELQNTDFALLANAGGDRGSGLDLLKLNIEKIAGFIGKTAKMLTIPFCPIDTDEIRENYSIREKAFDFGKKLAE